VDFDGKKPVWDIVTNCVKEQWLMGCSATGGKEADSGMKAGIE
jgi:hypothetical protein